MDWTFKTESGLFFFDKKISLGLENALNFNFGTV